MPNPVVIYASNPFNVNERICKSIVNGTNLLELVPNVPSPLVCVINGQCISNKHWDCILENNDIVIFHTLPQGNGKNPLQTILSIVLIVVGAFTFNPYLIAAGVGIGLAGLVPVPKVPTGIQSSSPSPTYNIALAGNSARLGEAIPIVYGRHIVYPDFAAQPYTENDNDTNDQFYFALLCLGNSSDVIIESILIDDTDITSFEEVQYQIQGSSFTPIQTLVFPAVVNAVEVAGQTLETARIVGPFAAVGPTLRTNKIAIDITMSKGLFFANDDGGLNSLSIAWTVQYRTIDDLGEPTGSWLILASESFTAATNKPIRRTYNYNVSSDRYEVRLQRTDARQDNNRAAHDIEWSGMRSFLDTDTLLEPTAAYLAIKIRATSQLSGTSQRKIAVILKRKLRTWNPIDGWTAPVETKSIAWALADVLQNPAYSINLSDSRLDLQTLYELDLLWASRGDSYSAIVDKKVTVWQMLTAIARCGRAVPIMRGGVFTFVRDSEVQLPSALFNMRNIQRNTFSLSYAMVTEDTPDGIELEYFDQQSWSLLSVIIPIPGIITPTVIAKFTLIGITNRNQALREAAYIAADIAYRRTTVRFVTEMEGFLPAYGSLIAVSHDIAQWGISADVEEVNLPEITISEIVQFTGAQFYALLADTNGDVHGPYRIAPGSDAKSIVFIDTPSTSFYTGTEKERTRISIGPGTSFLKYCKVKAIRPKANDFIEIQCIVEDDRVHTGDNIYLPQFPLPRPLYVMANDATTYDLATIAQKSGLSGWISKSDGTLGINNDAGFFYQ